MKISDKLEKKLRDLPDLPGCYMMRDRQGRIIYVGKAVSLRKRVRSYFRDASRRSGSPKLRGLVRSIDDLDYMVVRNEAEAVLTEGRLIKDYKPRYNVSFKDDKRFLLLRVETHAPLPVFRLRRIRREDKAVYFGPYASSAAARATLDFVEKRFGLRKCRPQVPDEETWRHCLNDVIRYCSAPCVGKISVKEYGEKVEEACAFLCGERPLYLKELRAAMEEESASLNFERAAALRDTLLLLEQVVRRKARIASTPEMKKQDARAGVVELKKVLGLKHVPHVIEAYDVSNISGTFSVAGMVCAIDGIPQRNRYRRFRIKTVCGSDDPAMMAEVVRRRFSGEGPGPVPDLVLVDGGAAQLGAARSELVKLGLDQVPLAGLAKRFEEIYREDKRTPIRLPGSSNALKVLQRLRDEAHRFALTYHRRLRNQRIHESVLDEIPGIGGKRKELLFRHFGSVSRLRRASEARISDVPGIGPKMARIIKERVSRGY